MTTVAGEYEFEEQLSFVWDEREDDPSWKLEWGSQLIFPDLSDEDSVRYNASKQKRGEIFDKEGQGLAINGEVIDLAVVPNRFEEEESEIAEIADRLGRSKESIEQALDQSWVEEGSLVLIGQMPASELEAIEALYEDVPGFTYQMSEGRVYPFGEAAAHLIGYIRPITAEQLEERREEGTQNNLL